MARTGKPREFDVEEALATALQIWEHGYEASRTPMTWRAPTISWLLRNSRTAVKVASVTVGLATTSAANFVTA
jgi:hypothetical protein